MTDTPGAHLIWGGSVSRTARLTARRSLLVCADPLRDDGSGLFGRFWSPFEHGSRGYSCASGGVVGMSVSLLKVSEALCDHKLRNSRPTNKEMVGGGS